MSILFVENERRNEFIKHSFFKSQFVLSLELNFRFETEVVKKKYKSK